MERLADISQFESLMNSSADFSDDAALKYYQEQKTLRDSGYLGYVQACRNRGAAISKLVDQVVSMVPGYQELSTARKQGLKNTIRRLCASDIMNMDTSGAIFRNGTDHLTVLPRPQDILARLLVDEDSMRKGLGYPRIAFLGVNRWWQPVKRVLRELSGSHLYPALLRIVRKRIPEDLLPR